MTPYLFEKLLVQGEGDTIDFKEVGYFNSTVSSKKDKDADFLKDIIAFTNTIRQESAYIIIGVKDDGQKVGITDEDFMDGAVLQAKLRDKVNSVPKFISYPFFDADGLKYQIIEIPIVWYSSPCMPTVAYGNTLERGQVYLRRNSSNERATYDETVRLSEWLKDLPKLVEENSRAHKVSRQGSFQFDEVTIQKIFGNEAAEDEDIERLREYYFKNEIFDKIAVDLPLRILVGHKGIGKSALFNVAMFEDKESGKLPLKIKPDDVSHLERVGELQKAGSQANFVATKLTNDDYSVATTN